MLHGNWLFLSQVKCSIIVNKDVWLSLAVALHMPALCFVQPV